LEQINIVKVKLTNKTVVDVAFYKKHIE